VPVDNVLVEGLVALFIGDLYHLARDTALSFHILEPLLLQEPLRCEFRTRTLLATREGETDDVHWSVEGTRCEADQRLCLEHLIYLILYEY
jgi:hypothetical protein